MIRMRAPLAPKFSRMHVKYQRPPLYKKQLDAIFNCRDINGNPARYALIEASTKSGKTVGCLAWLFEQALISGGPGRIFGWIAPVYAQAEIAFRRLKHMVPRAVRHVSESDLEIMLFNGAIIQFRSGEKPDNLYGDDLHAAVVDEASRLREEAWNAVRSMITATCGPVRIIGNVKGRLNWFYRLARRAEMGEPGMAYARITADDAVRAGILKEEEIGDARSMLPENVYRELYEARASDDERNPFGLQHIAACTVREISDLTPIACGVDLAKHVNHSVIIGLDEHGHCAGFERFQDSWGRTKQRVLDTVADIPTLIDSTGVGDPVFEELEAQRGTIEGFVFTGRTKQQLLEGLAVAIQQHEIKFPDGPIRQELEVFEYEITRTGVRYAAPEGYHDDCVIALALAWEMLRRARPLHGHMGPGSIPRDEDYVLVP